MIYMSEKKEIIKKFLIIWKIEEFKQSFIYCEVN